MDIVDTENIKVPNSVIISGLTNTTSDEVVTEFLMKYGHILRTLRIDDPNSPHHKQAIVEYESGAAVTALESLLPYTLESEDGNKYQIRTLSVEYVSAVTNSATHSLFGELQKIAKLSGKSFESVLHEHLSECSQKITSDPEPSEEEPSIQESQRHTTFPGAIRTQGVNQTLQNVDEEALPNQTILEPEELGSLKTFSHPPVSDISQSFITTPEVQRVVVEHIVKSEAPASHASVAFRLRQFSGKVPCPTHEVDFDTWRNSVDLVLQDPDLSDLQRSRKILDSLVLPAANVVKPLGSRASPLAYIELLNSAFGTVEDGDELFAKFLNTLQDAGEKPSHYLHRLQTALTKALKRGGVSASEADRHLLRQFCRGCWDNALLTDLQLERKKDHPPPFPELLLQLRVEEDKHATKENRMKKHLASTRPRVSSHNISANVPTSEPAIQDHLAELKRQITELQNQLTRSRPQIPDQRKAPQDNLVKELKAQITEIQSHLARLKPSNSPKKANTLKENPKTKTTSKIPAQTATASQAAKHRPRPWYCFQCGEDGHIVSACSSNPNPSLVNEKRQQLKEKQLQWDRQNNNTPLN